MRECKIVAFLQSDGGNAADAYPLTEPDRDRDEIFAKLHGATGLKSWKKWWTH